ncbi:hypothetical protein [Streptomyces chryseus]
MTDIPTAITREQQRAACRALGLPPSLVRELRIDATSGVRASLTVRDREGRAIAHGSEPLLATVHIPYAQEVTTRGTA